MGAYLSNPSVEKKSDDFADNEKFSYGVSGMQGWRISMEDAHNCVPYLGEDTSLFGVYDGHGGSEVALYCSLHFSEVLKETEAYKRGEYEAALEEAFMIIDKVLTEPGSIRELKVLADRDPDDGPPTEADFKAKESEEDYEEDETKLLHEEATMSIEELLARYGKAANETKSALEKAKELTKKEEESSNLEAVKTEKENTSEAEPSSSTSQSSTRKTATSAKAAASEEAGGSSYNGAIEKSEGGEKAVGSSSSSIKAENEPINGPTASIQEKKESEKETRSEENDEDSGDATAKTKKVSAKVRPQAKVTSKIQTKLRPTKLQALVDEEDIDDDEEDSDSEDGFESDEAVEGSSDTEQEESSDEEEDEDDEEPNVMEFPTPTSTVDEPGKDSGTTAVVAFLHGRELYVANAGDSRCVLSRKGKALDMSEDHKPEDEGEMKRIKAAGGHVNFQGRVNGGLNLSRAIGDHCYKANTDLELKDQMISAMPDVRKIRLLPGDEFMVLACDGIWNVFSSQEVVDFVQVRLPTVDEKDDYKLSSVCEELFDISLAPDTMGDGTGCDNMTCILIRFNQAWLERCESDDPTPPGEIVTFPDEPIKDAFTDSADHEMDGNAENAEDNYAKKKSVDTSEDVEENVAKKKSVVSEGIGAVELNSGDNGKADVKNLVKACKRSRTDENETGAKASGLLDLGEEKESKRPKVA